MALVLWPYISLADNSIEEILVVAQKRVQSLQDVPASVSVLTDEVLQNTGIEDIFDVARQVPSLDIVQNAGPLNTSFRIRRIGNEANIPNFEPAVGLFIDGAFRSRSSIGIGDLFDIDSIEVLRGPQSTLYGKSTTAGLISIMTRKPTDAFEFWGEISAGQIEGADTTEMTRVSTAVSGPLSDKFSGRFSGSYFNHGHTMMNLFSGGDSQDMTRYSLRGQLLYAPTDNLEARLIIGRFVIDSANTSDSEIDEGVSIAAINASFGVPCPMSSTTDRAFCNNRAGVMDLQANDVTLHVNYDLHDYTLISISGYEEYVSMRNLDADQLNIDLLDFFDMQASESYSQELRITSHVGENLEWLSGIYYYHNDYMRGDPVLPIVVLGPSAPLIEFMPGVPFGQPGDSGFFTSRTETKNFSVFGNAVWRINEKIDLTAGIRWQTEDKRTDIVNAADHTTPTLITVGLLPASSNAMLSRDTEGFAWTLSAQYRWSDDVMTYMSLSKGFKSGGFNGGFGNTPAADREFSDETVMSYEFGAKTMLAGNRLRVNASIFRTEYDDLQSAGFISLRFQVNNAERVNVSGVELDIQASLSESLSAALSLSYADAEYELYTGGSCYFGRAADNADGTACVLTGSSLPFAPKWKTSASLEYERPVSVGDWYARIDWTWNDEYYTNATLDPRHVQGSYSLVNLRSGLQFGRFDLSAWVNNVGDETFVMQDGPSNLFAGDPAFNRFLGAPRSYGITLRAQW